MLRISSNRIVAAALLVLAALWASSCAAPLGPGYSVEKQALEIHFVPQPEPHLLIHASYSLVNSGHQPLTAIRFLLPAAANFRRKETHADWDGQSAALALPAGPQTALRADTAEIPLPAAWPQKQKHLLTISYELSTGSAAGAYLAVSKDTFFASAGSWAPALLPPAGFLAKGGKPPKKWELSLLLPAGFLAHASGENRGTRRSAGGWTYRFEQRPEDFAAFAAGGRYVEQQMRARGEAVVFWTLQPLQGEPVRAAGERIAERVRYLETEYGPRGPGGPPMRLLECIVPREEFGCGQLPGVVLLPAAWFRGDPGKEFFENVVFEFAYTWFGDTANVDLEKEPLPMDALPAYAGWEALANSEGGNARMERIRRLILDYDERSKKCVENSILDLSSSDPGCEYPLAWAKSGLFFFALEDRFGREAMHRGMRHLVQSRRGQFMTLSDLISALEQESHQNVAEYVRLWLKHPGIPGEFRARYAVQPAPAATSSKETTP